MTGAPLDEDNGTMSTSASEPVVFQDDGEFRHVEAWNSFQFDPPLTHTDALKLVSNAEALGYRMLFRHAGYSIEQIQQQLVDRGPSSFLKMVWLQEDISPKAPAPTVEHRMAERMRKLAPRDELIITDPYLFTGGRKNDSREYAESVVRMIEPALTQGLRITALVSSAGNNATVRATVLDALHARGQNLNIKVVEADDFHDRFWIADRERGLIVGASLNKIGSRIFFIDELSSADVKAVLSEVDTILGTNS